MKLLKFVLIMWVIIFVVALIKDQQYYSKSLYLLAVGNLILSILVNVGYFEKRLNEPKEKELD